MLAFDSKGFPSAAASKEAYFEAIRRDGFGSAHSALLEEARDWFLDHGHTAQSAAGEGKLIHHAALHHARAAGISLPDRGATCILLTDVFETEGVPIVAEERASAAQATSRFMSEFGIQDEAEARRRYTAASIAAAEEAARARRAEVASAPRGATDKGSARGGEAAGEGSRSQRRRR